MNLRILSIFLSLLTFGAQAASNSTRPLQCFVADADRQNLFASTTFSTAYNAVAYRTIPILMFLVKDLVKPDPDKKEPSAFGVGLYAAMETATAPTSVVFNALQTLAVASFLVPPWLIRRSYQSEAECKHATAAQSSPNTTRPLECYKADAYDSIFSTNTAYSFGLALGVYLLMPVMFSAIPAWVKACKKACENSDLPTIEPTEPESSGFWTSLGKALKEAMISADKYALIDASQVTAILAFVAPIWGWTEKFQARAECDYALQNSTVEDP